MLVYRVLAEDILVVLLGDIVIGTGNDEIRGLPLLCHRGHRLGAGGGIFADDDWLLLRVDQLLHDGAGGLGLGSGVLVLAQAELLARVDETQLRGRGRVEQSLYLWSKLALEGYILRTLGDGMEMAFSIEGRLPFLDNPGEFHAFYFLRPGFPAPQ